MVNLVTPDAIKLGKSYGYNDGLYVVLMRFFVLLWEYLIFVPALIKVLGVVYSNYTRTMRALFFFVIMMVPATIFTDHGHF